MTNAASRKKILLVEDDPDVSEALTEWLRENDYKVEAVYSGPEALEHLECRTYDMVLLDGHLPGMDGEFVCKRYREAGGKTPVLMLTGQTESEAKAMFVAAGANGVLEKPFDLDNLISTIEKHM